MSSVLHHINFETSAGFVNILVAILLNRSFIHSSLLVLTTIMLFFMGLPDNQLCRPRKFKTQQHASSHSPGSFVISLQFLKELHWIPINQRIIFKLLLIVYKCTNNVAPSYLTELLSKYLPTRTLRSGNMELLKERKSNCPWGARSFRYCSSSPLKGIAI